jgi:lysozyme
LTALTQTNAWGPDVSHWNPVAHWEQLAASGATIFGAKVSDGATYADSSFHTHRDGFRAQPNFLLGIYYHFARMTGPADQQARRLVELVGDMEPRERLCLDFEEPSLCGLMGSALRVQATAWIDLFMQTLLDGACSTRRPFLYTSQRVWAMIGNPSWTLADEVDLWLPRYSASMVPPLVPNPWNTWTLWQFSDGNVPSSIVPGIGACDTSVFAGDVAALARYMAGGGTASGPIPQAQS